jgi:hypothetical protein
MKNINVMKDIEQNLINKLSCSKETLSKVNLKLRLFMNNTDDKIDKEAISEEVRINKMKRDSIEPKTKFERDEKIV